MQIPDKIISQKTLKQNNGEGGTRKYIAFQGIVYDVSDCPHWRNDLHEQMHFPGLDLSTEMDEAPHNQAVFKRPCVVVIGRLQLLAD